MAFAEDHNPAIVRLDGKTRVKMILLRSFLGDIVKSASCFQLFNLSIGKESLVRSALNDPDAQNMEAASTRTEQVILVMT